MYCISDNSLKAVFPPNLIAPCHLVNKLMLTQLGFQTSHPHDKTMLEEIKY